MKTYFFFAQNVNVGDACFETFSWVEKERALAFAQLALTEAMLAAEDELRERLVRASVEL